MWPCSRCRKRLPPWLSVGRRLGSGGWQPAGSVLVIKAGGVKSRPVVEPGAHPGPACWVRLKRQWAKPGGVTAAIALPGSLPEEKQTSRCPETL